MLSDYITELEESCCLCNRKIGEEDNPLDENLLSLIKDYLPKKVRQLSFKHL